MAKKIFVVVNIDECEDYYCCNKVCAQELRDGKPADWSEIEELTDEGVIRELQASNEYCAFCRNTKL